jgi:CRISPR-associated endoribonuclease Cas6
MRLVIKLRCAKSSAYEMQYHYYLQGFIYNLLKGSKYHYIHNKEGYKFFCFSNIFPATKNLEKNDLRTLIISSPDYEFIAHLYEMLNQSWNSRG